MSHFKVKNLATFITFMILYNFHFYLAPNASVLWLIFHRVEITHFTYPFISQPTLGFFTLFGYYELCYEYPRTGCCMDIHFHIS